MCHIFIHSSADGILIISFWLLWMILLWTFVYTFLFEHLFQFWGYIARSGIAGSHGNFEWCQIFPSYWSFSIPTSNGHGLQFPKLLPGLILSCLLIYVFVYYSHPSRCDLIVDGGSLRSCAFPQWLRSWNLFSCAFWPFVHLWRDLILFQGCREANGGL